MVNQTASRDEMMKMTHQSVKFHALQYKKSVKEVNLPKTKTIILMKHNLKVAFTD